jgi:hypothetical protein
MRKVFALLFPIAILILPACAVAQGSGGGAGGAGYLAIASRHFSGGSLARTVRA